jgi:prepilin-type N-terminal cleavage/methylation domain-containing protein
MKKFFKSKKGFTLTELIIVVAILGLLAAVATPSLVGYIDQGKAEADLANAKIIENVIQRRLADGTLAAADLTSAGLVKAAVVAEIGAIPEVKSVGNPTASGFQYTEDTGRVTFLAAVPASTTVGYFGSQAAAVNP